MRGSLAGVRARVDRLASRVRPSMQGGCPQCYGKEHVPNVVVFYGHEAPNVLPSQCEACGRLIPQRIITIGYDENMKPTDMP